MKTLKIAIFHGFPCGGAKRSLFEITKRLTEKHTIDLYNLSIIKEDAFDLRKLVRNVHTFEYKDQIIKRPFGFLNIFTIFLNIYKLDRVYRKIATAINRGGYDIAYTNTCIHYYDHAPGILRYLSIPSIYHCAELRRVYFERSYRKYPIYKKESSLIRRIYGFCLKYVYGLYRYCFMIYDKGNFKKANLVLCSSEFIKEYLHKIYHINAVVNYRGVNAEEFKPLGITRENLVISVGHLEARKAHDFVINAIAGIPPSIRPRLAIVCPVSQEPYKTHIDNLASEKKVEVLFVNRPLGDMNELYSKAKLTVCASIEEPFGLVPLESMACEAPVVAIREAGLVESIRHNGHGILTDRNISEFSRAIEYLLQNDELRIKMGKTARQYVLDNWSWQKSVEELEAHFLRMVENA